MRPERAEEGPGVNGVYVVQPRGGVLGRGVGK